MKKSRLSKGTDATNTHSQNNPDHFTLEEAMGVLTLEGFRRLNNAVVSVATGQAMRYVHDVAHVHVMLVWFNPNDAYIYRRMGHTDGLVGVVGPEKGADADFEADGEVRELTEEEKGEIDEEHFNVSEVEMGGGSLYCNSTYVWASFPKDTDPVTLAENATRMVVLSEDHFVVAPTVGRDKEGHFVIWHDRDDIPEVKKGT